MSENVLSPGGEHNPLVPGISPPPLSVVATGSAPLLPRIQPPELTVVPPPPSVPTDAVSSAPPPAYPIDEAQLRPFLEWLYGETEWIRQVPHAVDGSGCFVVFADGARF